MSAAGRFVGKGGTYVGDTHQRHNSDCSRCTRWQCSGRGVEGPEPRPAGNTIAGAIGGSVGGQILALLPILSNAAGSVDVGTLLGQAVGGGVAGAIVTAVVGLIKNKMA